MNEELLILNSTNKITNFFQKTSKQYQEDFIRYCEKRIYDGRVGFELKTKRRSETSKAKIRSLKRGRKSRSVSDKEQFEFEAFINSLKEKVITDKFEFTTFFGNQLNSTNNISSQKLLQVLQLFSNKELLSLLKKLTGDDPNNEGLSFIELFNLLTSNIQNLVTNLMNKIASMIESIIDAFKNLIPNFIESFNKLIDSLSNLELSDLTSLIGNLESLLLPTSSNGNKGLEVLNNFFKRNSGESSTSKYIQAVLPNSKGGTSKNSKVLNDTPDKKIIQPKLKKDSNEVKSLKPLPEMIKQLPSSKESNSKTSDVKNISNNPLSPDSLLQPLTSLMDSSGKITSSSAKGSKLENIQSSSKSLDKKSSSSSSSNPLEKLSSLSPTATKNLSEIAEKKDSPAPLIPSEFKTEVKEETPTGEKSEYGKIQVKENKGGFVQIMDETPGNVRKVDLHPSGSYTSILDNGDSHQKTTGNKVDITEKDWKVTVMENAIIIVYKDSKVEIRNDKFENIKGSNHTNIDGSCNTRVSDDVNNNFSSNLNEKISGDCNISIGGNEDIKVSGNLKESVSGNYNENVSGNLTINVSGNVNITGNKVNVTAKSMVAISAPKIMLG